MPRELGTEAEARLAAEAAAKRQPTRGEVVLELDPTTGRLRTTSQGIKGATPETFQNYGASLASAAEKISAGKMFDMTAAEKIAWNRTKVEFVEVLPELKGLDNLTIANKMLDRELVQQAITKAREKAIGFEEIAKRAKNEQAKREATVKREQLMDLAEDLEDQLRSMPKKKLGQGPKTREAQRNMLNPNQSNQNNLMR